MNDILPNLKNPPSFILLENVKGFEQSDTHHLLISKLKSLNYNIQEFWLSPNQFYIPNQRLRYFLLVTLLLDPVD
jgi:tRNA (cytosine38-C5)-methyltransferase